VHFAELAALQNNVNLINVKLQPESTLQSVVTMAETNKNLLGIVLLATEAHLSKPLLTQLDQFAIPIVLGGTPTPIGSYRNIYSVINDPARSGYQKMNYLLKHGHRKIGLCHNEPANSVGTEHFKGIKQAAYDYGLRMKDLAQSSICANDWDDPLMVGYQQARDLLLTHDLTALIFQTIRGAFGGIRALYELKLSCPGDVSIIASLNHFKLESMSCPALTTVDSSNEDIIRTAFSIVLGDGSPSQKNYLIESQIVERESVRQL
jgi:LacI family transcriptional regulator